MSDWIDKRAMILALALAGGTMTVGAPAAAYDRPDIWRGFYVGVTGGYGVLQDTDLSGGLAGIHAGYNWQLGSVVIGLEADYAFANVGASWSESFFGTTVKYDVSIDQIWTTRARVGFLATPQLLIYATGGYAGAVVSAKASVAGYSYKASAAGDGGGVIGGGAEYAFTGNWLGRAEALAIEELVVVRGGLSYKF